MNRPITTLFMLMSVDGKISTGDTDDLDVDKDFPRITGIKEGLHQYYELEQQTDLHSLNSGRVFAKLGMNENKKELEKLPVSFIVIDNKPHLTKVGIENLLRKGKKLYIVTTTKTHPVYSVSDENLEIIFYETEVDFNDLMVRLKQDYKIERITIQTGGTLNGIFLREKLLDHVSVVVAPALIGGKDTSTIVDSKSLHTIDDLIHVKALKLTKADILEDSYLHLLYDVINDTEINS